MHLKHLHFPSLPSTNGWAKEHIENLEKNSLTVISAAQQTNGYGRFRHKWHSPSNQNLYLTYVFFLEKRRDDLCNVSQILAISAIETLNSFHFKPKIKWPNDILLNGKKMGGLLCETTRSNDHLAVITGIGLNVNMPEEELKKIDRPATSLFVESGEIEDQEALMDTLNQVFMANLETFLANGFPPFYEKFVDALQHKPGDQVQFHDYQKICQGTFEKINPDGSLSLKLSDGTPLTYYSGELL